MKKLNMALIALFASSTMAISAHHTKTEEQLLESKTVAATKRKVVAKQDVEDKKIIADSRGKMKSGTNKISKEVRVKRNSKIAKAKKRVEVAKAKKRVEVAKAKKRVEVAKAKKRIYH